MGRLLGNCNQIDELFIQPRATRIRLGRKLPHGRVDRFLELLKVSGMKLHKLLSALRPVLLNQLLMSLKAGAQFLGVEEGGDDYRVVSIYFAACDFEYLNHEPFLFID